MSYILDALKKKDNESNESVPDLQSQHYHSEFEEEDKNHWKYMVGILVILLLISLSITIYHYSKAIESSDEEGGNLEANTVLEKGDMVKIEAVTNSNSTSNKNGLEVSAKPISVKSPVVQKVVVAKPQTVKKTPVEESVVRSETSSVNNAKNDLSSDSISVNNTSAEDLSQLPAIRYTSHVYADDAKDRFVMLNGRALGIGQKLPNGVKIEDIYEDDLLISYRGKTYQIPSLTDVNQ